MQFTDEEIRRYQQQMKGLYGEELCFEDARERLRQLLHLYSILAHDPAPEDTPSRSP